MSTIVFDPALQGLIAYLVGLFTLSMLIEFLRAVLWTVAFIMVLKRFGFIVKGPRGR